MTVMLDAVREAQAGGATAEQLAPVFELHAPVIELQKKAMCRLDFISSENSMDFRVDQEGYPWRVD